MVAASADEFQGPVPPEPERAPAVKRGRFMTRLFPRLLSKAERDELAFEERERNRLKSHRANLEADASTYRQAISEKCADLGICYRYKKSENENGERVKKIQFLFPAYLRDEAIYLAVDLRPGHAPRGVGIEELSKKRTLDNLSVACKHRVLCKYTPEKGFWYIVERESGVRGIPSHVKYDEVLASRPSGADGLSICLGVGESKKPIWRSLGQFPHMLVAGTTGGGKSNFLNETLCTLLRYNTRRRLRLVLVDLKGGVEFSYFADVPHLLPVPLPPKNEGEPERLAAIIEDRKDVVPAFEWIVKEGERRLGVLKAAHLKTIGEHNYHEHNNPMPHIVIVVDEWADTKLEPKTGKQAEELLIARLAFSCPNITGSMLIIGNGRAAGLEPIGRAIFDWGHTQVEVQAPLINNKTVDETVAAAIKGKFADVAVAPHDVTDSEIFNWAVTEMDGKLTYREIWGKYRLRGMSQAYAQMFCKNADGQTVVVGATAYKVVPGDRRIPRKLVPLAEPAEQGPEPPATP